MGLLNGKTVVVTGGAGYLGSNFSKAIAVEGGTAIIADRDENAATIIAQEINNSEGRIAAIPVELDITSEHSIIALIDTLRIQGYTIDALVNNAYPRNKSYGCKLEDVSYESFCENVSWHLGGYFLVTKLFALYFKECGKGNVVSISSIYGVVPPRFEVYEDTTMTMPVEYAAIKAGVQHLMRYFVKYFKGTPIRFNCISPGGIRDRQPESFLTRYHMHAQYKGLLDPVDICGSLIFLLSDRSEFIKGQNLIIDDGWSL